MKRVQGPNAEADFFIDDTTRTENMRRGLGRKFPHMETVYADSSSQLPAPIRLSPADPLSNLSEAERLLLQLTLQNPKVAVICAQLSCCM